MFAEALRQRYITRTKLFDTIYQRINLKKFNAAYVRPEERHRLNDAYVRKLLDRVIKKDVNEYYRYHRMG